MCIHHVAVIGVGKMGLPMAARLVGAGFTVSGFDLDPERRILAQTRGIAPAADLATVLRQADAIVSSLPHGRDVEAVLTTPGALLDRRDRRVIVLDTSTTDPATSRRLSAMLRDAGHAHLDAPVSGGPAGAEQGALAMMIGGDERDLADASAVIAALATKPIHVGPSGAGNVAKLVNNMLVAAHMLTTGEALRLAEAAGVDADSVLRVVNAATGRSALSEVHFPRWIMTGAFDSGFSAGLMRKDVGLAMEMAEAAGVDLPLSRAAAALWLDDRTRVGDGEDFTRLGDYRAGGKEGA